MRFRLIASRSASPHPSRCGHQASYMTASLPHSRTRCGLSSWAKRNTAPGRISDDSTGRSLSAECGIRPGLDDFVHPEPVDAGGIPVSDEIDDPDRVGLAPIVAVDEAAQHPVNTVAP